MWATDATQVTTVRDGKVWFFAVAEHWNAEALGWHVSKRGTRHEALQAMSMVRRQFGHLGRDARGLALRHDHGSAFMAEDFQNQVKAWGALPSYAFVGQPETTDEIEQPFSSTLCYFPPLAGDRVAWAITACASPSTRRRTSVAPRLRRPRPLACSVVSSVA